MAYVQKNNPFPVTGCGRRRTFQTTKNPIRVFDDSPMQKRKPDVRRTIGPGKNFNKAKDTGTGAAAGGGMTEKGVTKKPSELKPGSKAAKRRKSFCARSRSWKSKRGLAARRRWNC
jgi:hypothetical protein